MTHLLPFLISLNILAILWIAIKRWEGYYEDMRFAFSTLTLLFFSQFLDLPIFIPGSSLLILTGVYVFNLLDKEGMIERVLAFLMVGITLSFLGGISIISLRGSVPDTEFILFLVTIGTVTGLLLHLIRKDAVITFVGSAMVMWIFIYFGIRVDLYHLLFAFLFSLILGLISYRERAVEITGVVAGTMLGMLLIIFGDIRWFLIAFLFSLLGSIFTRYRFEAKLRAGIAQEKSGVRSYRNVFANGLVGLAMAIAYGKYQDPIFIVGFLASFASATGDTLASEIGQTSRDQPILITTFEPVPPGTDGGITVLGELAAIFGAFILVLAAYIMGMGNGYCIIAAFVGGFMGVNFDSLLGATLERGGVLGNDGVNLLSTAFAAVVAAAIFYIIQV
ncbi:MAG: TIGR00297 family protein [Candidatus Syntrophoarchaeum sp. WYZ-LMO15]|nr:MAG: TIGR00297 family protein [Candidatus Syntrophoarchaeum sp. WYZ-LMO15]